MWLLLSDAGCVRPGKLCIERCVLPMSSETSLAMRISRSPTGFACGSAIAWQTMLVCVCTFAVRLGAVACKGQLDQSKQVEHSLPPTPGMIHIGLVAEL